jgi:hypothetical protein
VIVAVWVAHMYGLLGSLAFLSFYIHQAPPWRHIEDPRVRVARNDVLIWTVAVFVVFALTTISLVEQRFAFNLGGSLSWRIFVDVLITHRLYAQYKIRHERR